jgi:hypothetical protein
MQPVEVRRRRLLGTAIGNIWMQIDTGDGELAVGVFFNVPALAAGAPVPPEITEQEALEAFGPDIVYYATRLRGASNEKAKRELNFQPRPLEWLYPTQPGP